MPRNFPQTVDDLLPHLGLSPETPLEPPTGALPLREALITGYILNRVSKKFVKAVLEKLPEGEKKTQLAEIVGNDEAFDDLHFHARLHRRADRISGQLFAWRNSCR